MIWARLREKGYELSDADIMISAISIREQEKLVTLGRDFEFAKNLQSLMSIFCESKIVELCDKEPDLGDRLLEARLEWDELLFLPP